MFNFDNQNSETLSDVIAKLLAEVAEMDDKTSKDYSTAVDNIVKLVSLKNETIKIETNALNESNKLDLEEEQFNFEKEKIASWRPSTDAVLGAAVSVLGIVLVLHYEKLGVVTSKAFGFLGKMK